MILEMWFKLIAQFCFKRNINREEYLEFDVLKNKFVRNLKCGLIGFPCNYCFLLKREYIFCFIYFKALFNDCSRSTVGFSVKESYMNRL